MSLYLEIEARPGHQSIDRVGKSIVTSIRIEEEVFRKAKDLGLNVSKVVENALKDMIRCIERSEPKMDCENNSQNFSESVLVDRAKYT